MTKDEWCRAWKPRVLGVALTDFGQRGYAPRAPRETHGRQRYGAGTGPPPTAAYRTMSLPRGSKRNGKWVASSPHTGGVRGWGTSPLETYQQLFEIYEEIHITV